jgi:hypothetical protein
MKELFFRNAGKALIPADASGEEALAAYPLNVILRVKVVQPRSTPHHRFFFAFLNEVFANWPEMHVFQPRDADYMRGWLLVKAGFAETLEYDWIVESYDGRRQAAGLLKIAVEKFSGGKPFWVKISGTHIIAAWPQSIAFDKMDETEFQRVSSLVFAVVYAETGLDVEEHYAEWQSKNGSLQVAPTRRAQESHA